ncbi:hypothetical protein KVV02_005128 [Mortierella alpina]|uniref:Peptidase S28 n=1 Tax=Mortierella alpina TaxID=64518 RepID=A0A9P8A0T4_MORAP|nr:hypothetical protein KVV02_005128 [Mortierella alpina]
MEHTMATTPQRWILVLSALLSLTVLVVGQTTALPENDPSPSSWSSDNVGTINNRPGRSPFVKTLGLRHKPSMDWGMRARARNQVHWDKYWSELETGQEFDILSDLDLDPDLPRCGSNSSTLSQNTTTADGNSHLQLGADTGMQADSSNEQKAGTASTTPRLPPGDADPGYFFTQILDHYADPSPAGVEAAAAENTTTFRQRYRINSQFYKPGGPLILWLPGESPLHSLFLGRGLSFELANATSGLLVALEHRFYGNSIPRFQDAPKPRPNITSSDPVKDGRPKDDFTGMNARLGAARGRGVGGRAGVWGTASTTQSYSKSSAENKTNGANGSTTAPFNGDGGEAEGLPLDLLKYLTVDQSIEDIVYFMDKFPATHPSFFDDNKDGPPRWILTGCSYGGNLAAWTRQRHPAKVFAAFASSAPLRSTLDFFEYSTSQTDVFGEKCASQLALARDFLDGAFLMTDDFMHQMDVLDSRKSKDVNSAGDSTSSEHDPFSRRFTNVTIGPPPRQWTREARRAAKLRVLSWFSPDFANEYAVDGEEVHAAGWIWWTVASAVQYNAVVVPPTVKPTKTVVDVLCDTMALGYKDQVLQNVDQEKAGQAQEQEAFEAEKNSSTQEEGDPLQAVRFARTLAIWFRNQQFFTPTRNEDLQPSDMDPNSVQNLAGMAWLWQTCSELGYLQTTHPSTCCCGPKSKSYSTDDSTTTTTNDDNDDSASTTGADKIVLSVEANATCSLPKSPLLLPTSFSLGSANTSSPLLYECVPQSKPANFSCLPCRCYAKNASRTESVLSRLLTLEAAWQECQLYFHTTHSSPLPVHHDASIRHPDSLGTDSIHPQPSPLRDLSSCGPQDCSSESQTGRTNNDANENNVTHILLPSRYPNVESNVNKKFHGWRIAQESYQEQSGLQCDLPAGVFPNDIDDQSSTSASALDITTATTVVSSNTKSNWYSIESPSFRDTRLWWKKRRRRPRSGRSRYYFTNGEYDPWKELTLASPKALKLLGGQMPRRNKSKERQGQRRRGRNDFSSGQDPTFAFSSSTTTTTTSPVAVALGPAVMRIPDNNNNNSHRMDMRSKFSSNEVQDPQHVDGSEDLATEMSPSSGTLQEDRSKDAIDTEQSIGSLYGASWWHQKSDRNELRIISGASHCQDILYESSDLDSKELREERMHVLATFVRWIEIDIRRQQRMRRHRRRRRRESFSFRG